MASFFAKLASAATEAAKAVKDTANALSLDNLQRDFGADSAPSSSASASVNTNASISPEMKAAYAALDITYITPRLIVMGFPSSASSKIRSRNDISIVASYFRDTHGHGAGAGAGAGAGVAHPSSPVPLSPSQPGTLDNVLVVNLSEESYDPSPFEGQVLEVSIPGYPSPPLALLLRLCVLAQAWLDASPAHVLALHCATGRGRSVLAAAAILAWLRPAPAPTPTGTEQGQGQQQGQGESAASATAPLPSFYGDPLAALAYVCEKRGVGSGLHTSATAGTAVEEGRASATAAGAGAGAGAAGAAAAGASAAAITAAPAKSTPASKRLLPPSQVRYCQYIAALLDGYPAAVGLPGGKQLSLPRPLPSAGASSGPGPVLQLGPLVLLQVIVHGCPDMTITASAAFDCLDRAQEDGSAVDDVTGQVYYLDPSMLLLEGAPTAPPPAPPPAPGSTTGTEGGVGQSAEEMLVLMNDGLGLGVSLPLPLPSTPRSAAEGGAGGGGQEGGASASTGAQTAVGAVVGEVTSLLSLVVRDVSSATAELVGSGPGTGAGAGAGDGRAPSSSISSAPTTSAPYASSAAPYDAPHRHAAAGGGCAPVLQVWTKGGSELAWSSSSSGQPPLVLEGAEGGPAPWLTTTTSGHGSTTVHWAPVGSTAVFKVGALVQGDVLVRCRHAAGGAGAGGAGGGETIFRAAFHTALLPDRSGGATTTGGGGGGCALRLTRGECDVTSTDPRLAPRAFMVDLLFGPPPSPSASASTSGAVSSSSSAAAPSTHSASSVPTSAAPVAGGGPPTDVAPVSVSYPPSSARAHALVAHALPVPHGIPHARGGGGEQGQGQGEGVVEGWDGLLLPESPAHPGPVWSRLAELTGCRSESVRQRDAGTSLVVPLPPLLGMGVAAGGGGEAAGGEADNGLGLSLPSLPLPSLPSLPSTGMEAGSMGALLQQTLSSGVSQLTREAQSLRSEAATLMGRAEAAGANLPALEAATSSLWSGLTSTVTSLAVDLGREARLMGQEAAQVTAQVRAQASGLLAAQGGSGRSMGGGGGTGQGAQRPSSAQTSAPAAANSAAAPAPAPAPAQPQPQAQAQAQAQVSKEAMDLASELEALEADLGLLTAGSNTKAEGGKAPASSPVRPAASGATSSTAPASAPAPAAPAAPTAAPAADADLEDLEAYLDSLQNV